MVNSGLSRHIDISNHITLFDNVLAVLILTFWRSHKTGIRK